MVTIFRGTGSLPNSKQAASHTPLTAGFIRLSIDLFILDQFSSFHQKFLFSFSSGSSNFLVTVAVSCYDDLLAPDYMGNNSQYVEGLISL